MKDWRDDRSQRRAKAEFQRLAQRHSEIAQPQTATETAETPQHAKEVGPEKIFARSCGKDGPMIRSREPATDLRHDDPRGQTQKNPESFPSPVLHPVVGNIK